jgi:hypothetical protein
LLLRISYQALNHLKFPGGSGEPIDGSSRRNSLRLQESQPKSLAIEVVSSQSKVAVSVDGTTVRRLSEAARPAALDSQPSGMWSLYVATQYNINETEQHCKTH